MADWFQPIDIYCERIEPTFWAEPINALTNLAILIIGSGCFLLALSLRTVDMTVCEITPLDTHFLWYLLIAVMLLFLPRACIEHYRIN